MRMFIKLLLNYILHFSHKLSSSICFYELFDNLCTSLFILNKSFKSKFFTLHFQVHFQELDSESGGLVME